MITCKIMHFPSNDTCRYKLFIIIAIFVIINVTFLNAASNNNNNNITPEKLFEKWLISNGGQIDDMELYNFPEKNNRRGWRTLKHRKKGSLNILLPTDLIMSTDYFINEYDTLQEFVNDWPIHNIGIKQDPNLLFPLGMLIERVKGKSSKWFPYFNIVNNDTFKYMPVHPDSNINLMSLPTIDQKWILQVRQIIINNFHYIETLKNNYNGKYSTLFHALKNYFSMNPKVRLDTYTRTYLLFFSHGAYGPINGETKTQNIFLPGIDLLNHETYGRPQGPVQIANPHDGTSKFYYASFNFDKDRNPGDELFSSYDPIEVFEDRSIHGRVHKHCNVILFRRSGFVLDDQDRACFSLYLSNDKVDRILYEYGVDNIYNSRNHYSRNRYYYSSDNPNDGFKNGIQKECNNRDYQLISKEMLDGPFNLYHRETNIKHIFSLNERKDDSITTNILLRCRYELLYFILYDELKELEANMKMYLEKENEDKPERIAVMKVIYNGHIYVLTSFLQDLQDGLKDMFL